MAALPHERLVTVDDIRAAQARIAPALRPTPAAMSDSLARVVGREVWLKPEHRQRTGSFKVRGALNRIATIGQHPPGVVAASAGNHAQGVALAASLSGLRSTVFMPATASIPKVDATRDYGAQVVLDAGNMDEAFDLAEQFAQQTGAVLIPPFDDPDVIAGQGTVGLELAAELPEGTEVVLVPVGGGGLVSGVAAALKAVRPGVQVVGVEAAGAAAMAASVRASELVAIGHVATIADGIALKRPGPLAFAHVEALVDDIVTVGDDLIGEAIVLLLERAKSVVEPSGAVGLAALLGDLVPGTGPVALILSGGNVDPLLLARLIEHGLSAAGRFVRLRVVLADRPGSLARVTATIAQHGLNVIEVDHHRAGTRLGVEEAELFLTLESRGPDQRDGVIAALAADGFGVSAV